jgi:cysteine desulfurase
MGIACELAELSMNQESSMLADLRNCFEQQILNKLPNAQVFGSQALRLPNTSNISFPGIRASRLLKAIPRIAASTGSACDSSDGNSNHVLKAAGAEEDFIAGSIRFSIGRFTTAEQIDYAVKIITQKVEELRKGK